MRGEREAPQVNFCRRDAAAYPTYATRTAEPCGPRKKREGSKGLADDAAGPICLTVAA